MCYQVLSIFIFMVAMEDAMDASYDGLNHLAKQLLSEGTTTFLATTMTQSDENIEKALKILSHVMKIKR